MAIVIVFLCHLTRATFCSSSYTLYSHFVRNNSYANWKIGVPTNSHYFWNINHTKHLCLEVLHTKWKTDYYTVTFNWIKTKRGKCRNIIFLLLLEVLDCTSTCRSNYRAVIHTNRSSVPVRTINYLGNFLIWILLVDTLDIHVYIIYSVRTCICILGVFAFLHNYYF